MCLTIRFRRIRVLCHVAAQLRKQAGSPRCKRCGPDDEIQADSGVVEAVVPTACLLVSVVDPTTPTTSETSCVRIGWQATRSPYNGAYRAELCSRCRAGASLPFVTP